MTIEELKILISAETSGLKKEIKNVKSQMTGLNTSVKKSTDGITKAFKTLKRAIIVLGIGKVIKDSIMSGMKAVESENLFEVSMGRMADSARKWSNELQNTLGLNAYEVRKNVGVLYNMTTSMGIAENSAYGLSTGLTELAYDMGSFYNISNEEAFTKIRAGITGETEPLKRLGIIVHENTIKQAAYRNGIAEVGTELTQQQKVMARYLAIMEQTKNAQGDLARTIDSPANQLRILKTQLEIVKINLGQAFMPIVQVVLPILTSFAKWIVTITNLIAQFNRALFGVSKTQSQQASTAVKAAKAQTQVGNAVEEAGKKAKGSIAGFDEINQLQEKTNGNTDIGNIEIDSNQSESGFVFNGDGITDTETKIQRFADSLKQTFANMWADIKGYGSRISEAFSGIKPALKPLIDINESIKQIFSEIGETAESLKEKYLKPLADYILLNFIPSIATSFTEVFAPIFADIAVAAFGQFADTFNWAANMINDIWVTVIKPIFDLIKDIILDTLEIVNKLWDKYGNRLLKNIKEFIQGVQDTFQKLWDKVLKPIIEPFLEMLSWLWNSHISKMVEKIGEFVFKAVNGALELYNGFIKPIVDWLIVTLGPTVSNVISLIIDVIGTVIGAVADVVGGIFETLGGLIDFVVGVFTGDWEKAWEGVKSIFGGIFDSLYGIVKVPLNLIIDAINFVIRGLNKISIDIPDWVPGLGGKSFGVNIHEITKLARGGIIDEPTLAMVGEAGKEAVVPLENTSFVNTLASAVGNAVLNAMNVNDNRCSELGKMNSSEINIDIPVYLDGDMIGSSTVKYINGQTKRIGTSPILL